MRDQTTKTGRPVDDGTGRDAGSMAMAQAVAAIIGTTRQAWAAPLRAGPVRSLLRECGGTRAAALGQT